MASLAGRALDRGGGQERSAHRRRGSIERLCQDCVAGGDGSRARCLLEEIAACGWSEARCDRFLAAYEEQIRRGLAVALHQLGLSVSRSGLDQLESRLTDRRMELLLDTRSDLWIELLDGLIDRFVSHRAAGKVSASFSLYLRGVIRHLMIRNARSLGLLPEESEAEMLRAIARGRTKKTVDQWVARLKAVFWHSVVHDILSRCPPDSFPLVYENIVHVTDHFFEIYVPSCVTTVPRNSLSRLVESYMCGPYADATSYVGHVAPFDPSPRCRVLEGLHSLLTEDEFLSRLALAKGGRRAP